MIDSLVRIGDAYGSLIGVCSEKAKKKDSNMGFLKTLAPHVHWGLRLSLAATFLYHGWGKFPVDAFSQAMGMPVPMAWAVALAELAAGVMLIIFRPFKAGDWVEAGGTAGVIETITIFNTVIAKHS